jgi:hypothetical protein
MMAAAMRLRLIPFLVMMAGCDRLPWKSETPWVLRTYYRDSTGSGSYVTARFSSLAFCEQTLISYTGLCHWNEYERSGVLTCTRQAPDPNLRHICESK